MSINIQAERLRRGMSRAALAVEIGVSEDVIRSAEDGRRPQPGNAVAIATYFGVDVLEQWPLPTESTEAAA